MGSPDPFWNRFGHQLGFHLGSILRPSGRHVGAMLVQKLILGGPGWLSKSTMKFDTFSNRFGSVFGSNLVPKWNQNRSKIGFKSVNEANAKIFRNIGRGCVFEDAGGRK